MSEKAQPPRIQTTPTDRSAGTVVLTLNQVATVNRSFALLYAALEDIERQEDLNPLEYGRIARRAAGAAARECI